MRPNAVGSSALIAMMAATRLLWPSVVAPISWWVAAALVIGASSFLWFHAAGPRDIRGWLWLAVASLWLAAIFWAANPALELLKPGSRRHDVASTVGGIELWSLLCPGLTIVALAGLARLVATRRR